MYVSFRSFIRKRRVREDETIINVATRNIDLWKSVEYPLNSSPNSSPTVIWATTCSSNSYAGGEVSQWLISSGSFTT